MEYIIIALIGFAAFVIKGITGTGTSTVLVSFAALIIPSKEAVVLASLVNVVGGLAMIRVDPVPLAFRYWGWVAIAMVGGSILGAWMLGVVPHDLFDLILGGAFLLIGLWFLLNNFSTASGKGYSAAASCSDLLVGAFAGVCGGFIGVNAPPLVAHFGRTLDKRHLRRLLVLIFIPAAIAQTATFVYLGQLTEKIYLLGAAILPAMALGIFVGNTLHLRLSEQWFRRILGELLILISLRLMN